MRTPAGTECPFFYGNYFRGRSQEECRLIGNQPRPHHWTPDLCRTCPVPGITLANACPDMKLKALVHTSWLGLIRRVKISAYCFRSEAPVKDPYIGCGLCHPLPPALTNEDQNDVHPPPGPG
ncbi:hypothetical protein [Anaerolinea thermolimosa]|uniref:hypothetical protein n=1 Tax=Anaerolinea thermolimosa TaxID=229919 RepID=UPI00078034AF|nr:hypothetical protein [Anaerolinea thermolimosa]